MSGREQRRVRTVYNKAEYAEQRRLMLQAWADMLDGWIERARAVKSVAQHVSANVTEV